MKKILFVTMVFVLLAVSPVFAAHDHGSYSMPQISNSSERLEKKQEAKEGEALLKSCVLKVASLERRIQLLQAEISGRHVNSVVLDELKKLEEKLQEANEISRALQIF